MPTSMTRDVKLTLWVIAVAVVVLGASGCAPTYTDLGAFISEPRPLVTSEEYILAPPDSIRITSRRVCEINGHSEQIRPDGRITLPLFGSVFVAGKTCEQVSAELSLMAQEYYEDADVTLWVIAYRSKKIFVFGEVERKGAFAYNGTNTILGTLALAQPSRLADPSKIQILRPSPEGELRKRMTVNMNEMVKLGDTTLDAVLQEGDVIYVPPNPLAAVGLAIQQILLPLQPLSTVVAESAESL
jgi:polysaccharide export outer membrane protein